MWHWVKLMVVIMHKKVTACLLLWLNICNETQMFDSPETFHHVLLLMEETWTIGLGITALLVFIALGYTIIAYHLESQYFSSSFLNCIYFSVSASVTSYHRSSLLTLPIVPSKVLVGPVMVPVLPIMDIWWESDSCMIGCTSQPSPDPL